MQVDQFSREDFQTGRFHGGGEEYDTMTYFRVHCLRQQWRYEPVIVKARGYVSPDNIRQPRKCAYYMGYIPGFGPEEHKELKREVDTRRIIVISTLGGALAGAVAAISASLILD